MALLDNKSKVGMMLKENDVRNHSPASFALPLKSASFVILLVLMATLVSSFQQCGRLSSFGLRARPSPIGSMDRSPITRHDIKAIANSIDHRTLHARVNVENKLFLGYSKSSFRLDFQHDSDLNEEKVDIKVDPQKLNIIPPIMIEHEHLQPIQDHKPETKKTPKLQERRALGSMELFMLPRPVGPNFAKPDPTQECNRSSNENPRMESSPASTTFHQSKSQNLNHPQQHPQQTEKRPPMNHIAAFILSSTPSVSALNQALDNAVRTHPLLRARISGNGHPRMWLDPLRRMVRWNGWKTHDGDNEETPEDDGSWNGKEEHPLEFVVYAPTDEELDPIALSTPSYWGGSLRIKDIDGSTREDLDLSWQSRFEHDLDSGTVAAVVHDGSDDDSTINQDLWRLELHRLSPGKDSGKAGGGIDDSVPGTPCVLLMTMNHVISDQGSVNLVMDQILSDIVEIENGSSDKRSIENGAIAQPLPPCLEDSVLIAGSNERNNKNTGTKSDSTTGRLGISSLFDAFTSPDHEQLRKYALSKVQQATGLPALAPQRNEDKGIFTDDGTCGGILTPASILLFGKPAGGIDDITQRGSTVQYRTLPTETTAALVKKSKANRVPISMTLAAAVAVTCTDFFNEVDEAEEQATGRKSRVYKILQSLDTRRFAGATDSGDTLSCQAGSMDLLVGPLPDFLGKEIRDGHKTKDERDAAIEQYWKVAKQSFEQTSSFLKGGEAVEALRLFDLGMSVCDVGRLVETYAKSSVSKGRAWSAGITNVGEYERQSAALRNGVKERGQLKATRGIYTVEEIYYATSHARVGCTFPVGCITVHGKMSCTINPPWPLVSKERSKEFADAFIEILEAIAGGS